MSRTFIATVLSVAMTITGISAVPARATDATDLAEILGAAATLYLLGTAISNSQGPSETHATRPYRIHDDTRGRERDRGRTHDRPRHDPRGDRTHDRPRQDPRGGHGHAGRADHWSGDHTHGHTNRPIARERDRYHHRVLPPSCLRQARRHNGKTQAVYGRRCLMNRAGLRHLPTVCETNFRARNGNRLTGYRVNCMRHQGYVTAGRR